ncbi:MAG: bifunctional nuclease family protein [Sedimentisphaerales bacterium]|jgi:bifunctional DNase/RNase|nr:bifunctional nuclease family protein [Sedimentisphaerales bacterium]
MEIPVELSRIIINETSDQQLIVLKEKGGNRQLPIVIGIVEVFAIDRRLKGIKPPRPMTHDLCATIIDQLGARIDKIVIDDLRQHTFYAKIHLRKDDEEIVIDSRPSDAIAIGVATNTPMFVADHVFDKAGQ